MVSKFPPIKAHSIELALHLWFDWFDSIRTAREQLGCKPGLSRKKWDKWSKALDRGSVWDKAIATMDRLNLPRLFAGYWVACLVSHYDPEDIYSFNNIEYPGWVIERLHVLQDTLLKQKPPFGHEDSSSVIYGQGLPDRISKRALPPAYIGLSVTGPDSFITIHIPTFMLPGLIHNTSPLQELMKEVVGKVGLHPVSALLKQVGKSVGWEWERRWVAKVSDEQLRPLYDYLVQSEYYNEVLNESSERELKKAIKSLKKVTQDELLLAYVVEDKLKQSERKKIKDKARKRVSGWFKEAGRWPVPRK